MRLYHNDFMKGVYFMAAAYLPSVLVPLVGLVFPAIAMASLFLYIEKEEIA
jgi:photosystem I subunit 8